MEEETIIWSIRATLPDGTRRMVTDERGAIREWETKDGAIAWQARLRAAFPNYTYEIGCTAVKRVAFAPVR